jgi:predicted ATP-grasp superfamily ATP-dependent carboligase
MPGGCDVLILDASLKQSLAGVRSLGRAGLRVAAGESVTQFSPAVPLPAFQSRYCQQCVTFPDIVDNASAFAEAVIEFVRENSPRVVIPTGDMTISVLRPYRDQLADLGCLLALAPEQALEIANDKDRTLAVARELGIVYPRSVNITDIADIDLAAAEFGYPFVLKPTISWCGSSEERLVPVDVTSRDESAAFMTRILGAGSGLLAQEWVPGRREGVSLFVAGDEVIAACGHVAHRTSPPLGGASVVRESIAPPADTLDAAVRLAKAIGLQGPCEVEFRRDAAGRALLMEINARLAGTIENAVQSGIDLPLMIWRWATDQDTEPVLAHRTGVRTRWLHGDLRWLMQNWKRPGRPDSVARLPSIGVFLAEFGKATHYDYFDHRDMRPFLAELRYTLHVLGKIGRI